MNQRYHIFFKLFRIVSKVVSTPVLTTVLIWPLWGSLVGCAYSMGRADRNLPMGYHQMTIPMFKNYSGEVGVEVPFTNALIREFERSRLGRVVDPSQAEIVMEGVIKSITYAGSLKKEGGTLPTGSVLAASYTMNVVATVTVRRQSDQSVLWAGEFVRNGSYTPPQVTLPGINTVNPLYNLSDRRQHLVDMASDMMAEAHDRITENF